MQFCDGVDAITRFRELAFGVAREGTGLDEAPGHRIVRVADAVRDASCLELALIHQVREQGLGRYAGVDDPTGAGPNRIKDVPDEELGVLMR